MNKTVNINLAGIFFHIDEDAYLKLQRYLEAIKRSFTDSQGRSEIISDIEARIAELFSDRVQNEKQVIRLKEVDEVIAIMGQPEDYLVDDEIFEDEPKDSYSRQYAPSKKLFRDTDNSYIGGVSSGLGHYFGIDAIWIRLAWIILFSAAGTGILLYILLWILVPEAKTTAEKLMMTGEPVNISNIEKKIKDGFDTVTESVGNAAKNVSDSVSNAAKNVDVKKGANSIKSSSKTFFDTLGDIIMFFLKIFAKFIGVILIIIGASTLIALFISLFSIGTSSFFNPWWMDYAHVANTTGTPVWIIFLLVFFLVGIPFFFVFLLGLKILINNLKSIGRVAKFTLLGLWLVSFLTLAVLGIKEATEHSIDEMVVEKNELNIKSGDTLKIAMVDHELYSKKSNHRNGFKIIHDEKDNKKIYSSDLRFIVRSTKDSIATISINKSAAGSDFKDARYRANEIDYSYSFESNTLLLNSYFLTDFKSKYRDQDVEIIIHLPEGSVLFADDNTYYYHRNWTRTNDILDNGMEEHYLTIIEDDVECNTCPIDESFDVDIDLKDDDASLKINEKGIEVKVDSASLTIDGTGIKGEAEDVKLNIDSDGITVKTDE